VTDALIDLLRKRLDYLQRDGEAFLPSRMRASSPPPSNITA